MNASDEQAGQLVRMIAVLEAFAEGRIPRADVARFAREVWPPTSGQGTPFPGNGNATTVFDSIWNIEERRADEFVVRDSDVHEYLRWLGPEAPQKARVVAWAKRTVEEVARQLSCAGVRYWLDGLGWRLEVHRVSILSGRLVIVRGAMDFETKHRVSAVLATQPERPDLLDDILTTLELARDELELGGES